MKASTETSIVLVVLFHCFVCAANIAASITLLIEAPWYVSIPINTYLAGVFFGRCPLTLIENYLRRSCGLPEISSFCDHYFPFMKR